MKKLILALLILTLPAQLLAAELLYNEPISTKWMVSLDTKTGSFETRGGGLNLVFGPFLAYGSSGTVDGTLTASYLVGIDCSIGATLVPDAATPEVQSLGGTYGCGASLKDRLISFQVRQRIDPVSGERENFVGTMVDGLALIDMAGKATGLQQ